MSLTPITPRNEASITLLLEQTTASLTEAIRRSDLVQIGNLKAQSATVHEATKQLNLSRDIQLDAEEMVRRSEFWLGKAIRKGQDEGTVLTTEQSQRRAGQIRQVGVADADLDIPAPSAFASRAQLKGSGETPGIYGLADSAEDEATFEEALADARAEGNLSRVNVARKAREKSGRAAPEPTPSASDDASLALLNDIRGPWTRGITKSARLMTPKARAHLIDALENALTQIRNIR